VKNRILGKKEARENRIWAKKRLGKTGFGQNVWSFSGPS